MALRDAAVKFSLQPVSAPEPGKHGFGFRRAAANPYLLFL
jgi:hypothetical protein